MRHRSKRLILALAMLIGLSGTAALTAPLSASANTTPAATVPAAPSDRPIRIGLGWGLSSAAVSGGGGLLIVADGKVQKEQPAGQAVTLGLVAGKIQVDSLATPLASPIRLVPKGTGHVVYMGTTYRGEIEVLVTTAGTLSVVNVVNLEEYLQGVVPREMPSGWPLEALKAQAVAARSFALRGFGRRAADGFDLRSSSDDQVYGGLTAEQSSTNEAVLQTRGQVVTYLGQVVQTLYHSSSGGHTDNNEQVWTGTPVPYLRGVVDYDNLPNNPWFRWSYRYTGDEAERKLQGKGYGVGEIRDVIPGEPAASGRPSRWTVVGSTGQVVLTMSRMRDVLALPAAPTSITLEFDNSGGAIDPPPQTGTPDPVYVANASGSVSTRQVAGSYVVSAGGRVTQLSSNPAVALGAGSAAVVGQAPPAPSPTPTPSEPKVTVLVVDGGGNGHGIGLSQWGANGMALQGKSYKEILEHFYTGTKVETRQLATLGL